MSIVQASCPNCRKSLRIPSTWLNQAMRCKHCSQTFQPRAKSALPRDKYVTAKPAYSSAASAPQAAVTAKPAVAASMAAPANGVQAQPAVAVAAHSATNGVQAQPTAAPANGDTFSFGAPLSGGDGPSSDFPRLRRRGNPWVTGIFLGFAVLAVAGGVGFLYWDEITGLIGGESNPSNQVATNGDGKDGDGTNGGGKNNPTPNQGGNKDDDGKDGGKIEPKKDGSNPTPIKPDPNYKGPKYFPRRALLINVSNYLFANHVGYGHKRVGNSFPGSSTSALRDQLMRSPMNFPGTQVIELSDAAKQSHPTLKSVIETTIEDFLKACRKQDRIMLLFAGHAIEGEEDNAYLVPLEGDLDDPETLISMKWLYEQLAKCPAQQKVLLLDVCRYPTGRGFELPPRDPLGETLHKIAKKPPAGVQVWMCCKPEQHSVEYESGSLFIESVCAAMQDPAMRQSGIATETDPLPVDQLLPLANKYMAKLWPSKDQPKLQPESELFGTSPDSKMYIASEPLPSDLVLKMPKLKGGSAGKAMLDNILDEIKMIPATRAGRKSSSRLLQFSYLPPFPASALKNYQRDYDSIDQLKKMIEVRPDQFGLRKNVLQVIDILNENIKFTMKEKLYGAGGQVDNKTKAAFKDEQDAPAEVIFALQNDALPLLEEVKEKYFDKELSLRWKAMYEYTRARLLSRLIYVYEYSYMLGKVQNDLPELTPGVHTGWVIGSDDRVNILKKEPNVRDWEREVRKIWRRIKTEYAGTPWSMFAKREANIALGLEWRPSRN